MSDSPNLGSRVIKITAVEGTINGLATSFSPSEVMHIDHIEDIVRSAPVNHFIDRPAELVWATRQSILDAFHQRTHPFFTAAQEIEATVLEAVATMRLAEDKKKVLRNALATAMKRWPR